jgi:hypothetical protein
MPALLSEEWLRAQQQATATLPERPGCSARIQYEVAGPPLGTVVFHVVLEDGRIAGTGLGPDDDADFTVVAPLAEFREVVAGALPLDVGYMQGRVKVRGNIGRMLSVLPVTTSPEWRDAMDDVAAQTEDL